METTPFTIKAVNKKGFEYQAPHPLHKVYHESVAMSLKLADKFGLTPISAKRLGIKKGIKKKAFDN